MRQQQVGHLGAFVQREHGNHGPAGTAGLQGLDEGLLLALAAGRIGMCGRQRCRAPAAACQRKGCNTCSDQRPNPSPHGHTLVDVTMP
jgi:hypothetical protein